MEKTRLVSWMVIASSFFTSGLGESSQVLEEPKTSWNAGWLTSFAPLPLGIYDHAAVYVESLGKIYLFGGTDGTSVLDLCIEYDIANDSFAFKTPMPGGPRRKMAAAVVGGKIYVIGGEDTDTLSFLNRCEEYDPVGDTWTTMAPMPTPKKSHTAVAWRDTLLYVLGGIKSPNPGIVLKDVEIYDPLLDTWTPWDQVDGFIQARKSHASGIIGDEIIVSMGRVGIGPCLRSTEKGTIDPLNPTTISWTGMANLPFETQRGAGAALNGFFYIHLGDSCGDGFVREETYRLNPRCNLWERLPDKPNPVTYTQAFVAAESLLFIIGGFTGDSATTLLEALSDTILHDLGISVVPLPDTVYPDSTYTPVVNISNCGNVDETFEAVCLIIGYSDTIFVDTTCIALAETLQFSFAPWTVPPGDSATYVITCFLLSPDGGICPDSDLDTVYTPPAIGIVEERESPIRSFISVSLHIEPNPFHHSTTIHYSLPADGQSASGGKSRREVSLKIYDITGRAVRTLVDGNSLLSGDESPITVSWEGRDESGSLLPTGIYFLKLEMRGKSQTRKVVILR
ncbi:T9SS type A sorting domain-containing protein [candidate division TA06 bacterium]|nr:T9SS type A sorting domain-containing protein [candidate division TA06 bacterium]